MKQSLILAAGMVMGSALTLAVVKSTPTAVAAHQSVSFEEPQQPVLIDKPRGVQRVEKRLVVTTPITKPQCALDQAEAPPNLVDQLSYFQSQTQGENNTDTITDEESAAEYLKGFYYNEDNSFHNRLDAFSTVLETSEQFVAPHDIEHLLNTLAQQVDYIDSDDIAGALQMLTGHLSAHHIPEIEHHLASTDADVRMMTLSAIASSDINISYQNTIAKHYQNDPSKAVRNHTFGILRKYYSPPQP